MSGRIVMIRPIDALFHLRFRIAHYKNKTLPCLLSLLITDSLSTCASEERRHCESSLNFSSLSLSTSEYLFAF